MQREMSALARRRERKEDLRLEVEGGMICRL